jgi:hypothetical protein
MEKNKRYLLIAGIAIVAVIAIAVAIPHFKNSNTAVAPETTATVVDTPAKAATTKSTDGGAAAWNSIMAQYSGRLIVFGANCEATPNDHVQALGSTVLLVNNSDVDHTVAVGSASGVKIGARHYKTAKITASSIQVVSCDANQKAATITVK